MKVRMLGTFEVELDSRFITPSAPKLRQVLALLALQANTTVHTRQLVDELWEEQPPPSSSTTLQTYIYQLRKILTENGDGVRLETKLGGYLLNTDEEFIDARQFERLAAEGRSLVAEGQLERGADTIRRALALWRGNALSDVSTGPALQADVVRLEEIRYSLLELRIDADLALGRHDELISELAGYAARNPTSESLHARLMLALYRNGRRPEALTVFQRIRHALADELGLEPGPDLQRLQRAILSSVNAPELGGKVGVATSVHQAYQPPALLPPDVELAGRAGSRRLADAVLHRSQEAAVAVAVAGPPGAGTTAFCTHVAHLVRHGFPDGQFFASFEPGHGPSEVLGEFLEAVVEPGAALPETLSGRSHMFQAWAANRRVLIVLDNVVHAEEVHRLLPSSPGSAVLLGTGRRLCDATIPLTEDLRPLTAGQSYELLAGVVGEKRLQQDPVSTRKLITLCDGFPVPLRAMASWLVLRPHWSLRHLIRRLTGEPGGPTELAFGALDIQRSVLRRFDIMPLNLKLAFGRLVRQDSVTVSLANAARIIGVSEAVAEGLLEGLVEFRLLETTPDPTMGDDSFRYCLHPIVKSAAASSWEVRGVCHSLPVTTDGDPAQHPQRNG